MRKVVAVYCGLYFATPAPAQLSVPEGAKACVFQIEDVTEWKKPKYQLTYSCDGQAPTVEKWKDKPLVQVMSSVTQELTLAGWHLSTCYVPGASYVHTCIFTHD